MTAHGLLVLVAILSVIRGVFLLYPHLPVPAYGVKVALLAGVLFAWRAWTTVGGEAMEGAAPSVPSYRELFLLLVVLATIVVELPSGEPAESLLSVWTQEQKKMMMEYLDSVIIAGVTALLLIGFVVRSFYIPSESMVPTLQINDMLLVDELVYRVYRPARGDVIVFRPPPEAHSEGKDFIKRVVAVEGDTVRVENDVTYVNGVPVNEPFRNRPDKGEDWPEPRDYEPLTVPRGHVFCMGDNRPFSEDSRYWGTVPVRNIIGKAFLVFYPLPRAGLLR